MTMDERELEPTLLPITQQSVTYELFITAFTIFALIITFAYLFAPLSPEVIEVLGAVDTLFIAPVLLFDFFRSLVRSQRRIHYMVTIGWLDLLGSFPFFPVLRLLRLGRLIIAWRNLHRTTPKEILMEARQRLAQSTVFVTTFVAVIVLTVGSAVIVSVEDGAPNANIVTGVDAVWWSIVTVATVGYGDFYPVTNSGRFIAVLIMIVGVSIFSVLTGYLSQMFQTQPKDNLVQNEISALRAEVADLRTLMESKYKAE